MKYSILLPSYDPELKNHEKFLDMIRSIDLCSKGKDYELIIRKNSDNFVDSLNESWKSAQGDFLIFVHDDMVIEDPEWLEKFSLPDCFMTTGSIDNPSWSPHAMHRSVREEVGFLDPVFKDGLCYEDDDYIRRIKNLYIPFRHVDIKFKHIGGLSNREYRSESTIRLMEKNKEIFKKKWNEN